MNNQAIENMKKSLTPDENIINQVLSFMSKEEVTRIKSIGMSKFDFGMFIANSLHHMGGATKQQSFDTVFGEGAARKFQMALLEANLPKA